MQRQDGARGLMAWVQADLGRAAAIGGHPDLAVLGGLEGALRDLYRRWVTAFGVVLDQELEAGAPPGPATLARVCHRLAAEQPALSRVLEHHAGHPALREAREHHRRLLDDLTGGPSQGG